MNTEETKIQCNLFDFSGIVPCSGVTMAGSLEDFNNIKFINHKLNWKPYLN